MVFGYNFKVIHLSFPWYINKGIKWLKAFHASLLGSRVDIETFFYLNLTKDISELKTKKGLALQDILTEIHNYVHRSK